MFTFRFAAALKGHTRIVQLAKIIFQSKIIVCLFVCLFLQGQDGSKGEKGSLGLPGNPGEPGLRGKDVSKS